MSSHLMPFKDVKYFVKLNFALFCKHLTKIHMDHKMKVVASSMSHRNHAEPIRLTSIRKSW